MIPETLAELTVPIDDLKPFGRNPRRGNVELIAESLQRNGQYRPVVANRRTSEVLAGNHTLAAARSLGWAELAVTWVDVDDEAAARIALIDNRASDLAGFDDQALADLLAELPDLEGTGYTDGDLAALLESVTEIPAALTDPDDVPELPAEPTSVLGDVWVLGRHRVVCGDATDGGALQRLMRCDLGAVGVVAFTSPPYNAGDSERLTGNTHTSDTKYVGGHADALSEQDWVQLCYSAAEVSLSVCDFVVFNIQMVAGNKRGFIDLLTSWRDHLVDVAVWDKGHAQPAMAAGVLNSQFEWIIFLSSENTPSRRISTGTFRGTIPNVYVGPPQRGNEYAELHAATFPVHLPTWIIESFTQPGALVLDSFGGTGSTLIACQTTGRRARLIELDPRYVDVICRRYQELTGDKPVLESTGEPHDFTADRG